MKEIYRTAWESVRANWIGLAGLVALINALPLLHLSEPADFISGIFPYLLIAYGLHRYVLFGEPFRVIGKPRAGYPASTWRWFFLVSLLVFGAMVVLSAGMVFVLSGSFERAQHLTQNQLLMILLIAPVYLGLLSIFGTALPAAAAGDRFGLGVTLSRARRTGWGMCWRLCAGPGLFWVIGFAALFVLMFVILSQFGIETTKTPAFTFAAAILMQLISIFATALAVAIQCRAYRQTATG